MKVSGTFPGDAVPLVSVVIPTFRRPDTIARAVAGVLEQTWPNLEVIVVDDNDPESAGRRETEKAMAAWSDDARVRYVRHESNRGVSAARNTGVGVARGEYISFLDDDDEFLPENIEKHVSRLSYLGSEWGASYCSAEVMNQGFQVVLKTNQREGPLSEELLNGEIWCGTPLLFFRRSVLRELGGFDERFFRHQDWDLLLRFFERGYRLALVPEVLVVINEDSRINRPGPERMVELKEIFLGRHRALIESLPKRRRIYKKHWLEVVRACFRARPRRLRTGFTFLLRAISYAPLSLAETRECLSALSPFPGRVKKKIFSLFTSNKKKI